MSPRPLSGRDRLILAGVAAALLAGFLVAWTLSPSRDGLGTHRQLGLPPCGLLTWTGLPCPGCGLTTSISHIVHGEFAQAWRVQPVGWAVAVASALAIIVCTDASLRGRWRWSVSPLALAIAAVWTLNVLAIGRWVAVVLL